MKRLKTEQYKYLIVGGGVAGTTAAETIRKNDPEGTIAIAGGEPYNFYSRIMLSKPNFFLGKVPFDSIFLRKDEWYAKNRIDLFCGKSVTKLSTDEKFVELDEGTKITYEKLLLTVGSKPRRTGLPGEEKAGVYFLRTLDDAKAIIEAMPSARNVIVIGGGFIGFEMCELMLMAGKKVTFVIREDYYWQPLIDETAGRMIEAALKNAGVNLLMKTRAKEIVGEDKVSGVILENGEKLDCDMVMVGVGAEMGNSWIKACGLAMNRGILTNEKLATSIPDIWAAGDCAEYKDFLLEERVLMGNWANAQEQGRTAGANMTGAEQPFKFVSFYTTQGLGITIAFCADNNGSGEGKTAIARPSKDGKSYGLIIAKDGELVGATLINRTPELALIRQIIEKNIKIAGHEADLADAEFDLKQLL